MVQKLHAAQAVWLHPAILDAVAEEAVSLYFRREHGRRAAEIAAYADPFFAAGAFISEKLRVLRQEQAECSAAQRIRTLPQRQQPPVEVQDRIRVCLRFVHVDLPVVRIHIDPRRSGCEARVGGSIPLHGRTPLAQPKKFPAVHQAWLKKEISAREAAWRLSVTHKTFLRRAHKL